MAKIKELDIDIDLSLLQATADLLNVENDASFTTDNQVAFHKRENSEDPYYESCGSYGRDLQAFYANDLTHVPVSSVVDEKNFNIINEKYVGTYFEKISKEIEKQYKIYRGRFMLMNGKKSLSLHEDKTLRIHVPIITNPKCFMVIENEVIRLPAGKVYLVDTTLEHTAVNASLLNRTHLVFCTDIK